MECGTSIRDYDKKGANTISKLFRVRCPTCSKKNGSTDWLKLPEFVVHHKLPWVECKHCDAIRHDVGAGRCVYKCRNKGCAKFGKQGKHLKVDITVQELGEPVDGEVILGFKRETGKYGE